MSVRHEPSVKRRLSPNYQLVLVGEGLLVGVLAGGVICLYRLALSWAEGTLRTLTEMAHENPFAIAGWFLALAAICLLVGALMMWEPNTQGSGIPQTDAEVMGRLDMPWYRVLPAKLAEGTLCALGGLSLGREGPSVQLGAVSGKAVAWALGRGRGEGRLLSTCGAAAGMAAAFNAPLTGVLFALEEIHKEFTPTLILSVMASAVGSDFFVSQILGIEPVLTLVFFGTLPHNHYLLVILLGLVCGVLGALHNMGMFACQDKLYAKLPSKTPFVRLAIPFVLAGIVAFVAPRLMCGGDAIVELFESKALIQWKTALMLLVLKYAFTTLCFGSGAPGGTLFPLVVMGMLIGDIYGVIATSATELPSMYISNFVVMAVAGLFASVVQAPVTGVVLAFELTGNLEALLAVSVVSIVSYTTVKMLGVDPFYEHLLARLLNTMPRSHGERGTGGKKVLHTHTIGANSLLDDKLVSEIEWPEDVRIVIVKRAGEEMVPTGDTKLLALDELLLIMNVDDEYDAQQWAADYCRGALAVDTANDSADTDAQA